MLILSGGIAIQRADFGLAKDPPLIIVLRCDAEL